MIERRKTCEHCHQVEQAVENAVRKVFNILGVAIDNPESVEEFREDLRFSRRMRKLACHSVLAMAAVVAAGMMAALWAGITSFIRGR